MLLVRPGVDTTVAQAGDSSAFLAHIAPALSSLVSNGDVTGTLHRMGIDRTVRGVNS